MLIIRLELDLIDEKRADALTHLAVQERKVERYYNSKVILQKFTDESLVLRKVFQNTKVKRAEELRPTWEGLYHVHKALHNGTYKLEI